MAESDYGATVNFLQLVQRLHYEAGVQGTAPSSVYNQTGTHGDLVRWIDTAYQRIQEKHSNWDFLRTDFSKSTESGTQAYSLSDWSLTDLAKWRHTDDSVTLYSSYSDEGPLVYLPWDSFKMTYLRGTSRSVTGRPTVYSIKPDKSFILYPTPNAVYTVVGEYWKQAQSLVQNGSTADNSETPIFNSHHMAIVWRALMLYAADVGADDLYSHGNNEFNDAMFSLERDELPEITWGQPLA